MQLPTAERKALLPSPSAIPPEECIRPEECTLYTPPTSNYPTFDGVLVDPKSKTVFFLLISKSDPVAHQRNKTRKMEYAWSKTEKNGGGSVVLLTGWRQL